jgi:hypothetical protein
MFSKSWLKFWQLIGLQPEDGRSTFHRNVGKHLQRIYGVNPEYREGDHRDDCVD